MRKPFAINRAFTGVRLLLAAVMLVFVSAVAAQAQTSAFSYQGRLAENGVPSNANYTMKFRLFDALTAGNQVGSEITQSVTVTGGIFTVSLDFGAAAFPASANRWLEIQVAATTLTPRQQLLGSPFAVRTLSSNQADLLSALCNPCVTDLQIVGLSGLKITGSVANADHATNADTATNATNATNAASATTAATATNSLALGGVAASNYLQKSGGTITGSLSVTGVVSGDGSGLTNLPSSGFAWLSAPGTAVQAQSNKGYLVDNAGQVTVTLPDAPSVSDTIRISSAGAGGFKIAQNAGQSIVQTRNFNPETADWTTTLNGVPGTAVALSADGTKAVSLFEYGCGGGPCMANPVIRNSTDSGATWTTQLTGSGSFSSVASSTDRTKLIASIFGSLLLTSTDSGVNWTFRESARQWKAVASSGDGSKLVAVVNGGRIYTSTDSGVTWTPRETNRDWHGVASSADGSKLAAVVWGGFIYTSTDSGVTWTPGTINKFWTTISMSADGSKMVAGTGTLADTGELFRSPDSGGTWDPVTINSRVWRGVALSSDGAKYIVAGDNSSIYTSDFLGTPVVVPNSTANWKGVAISADGAKKIAISNAQVRTPTYRAPLNTTIGTGGYLINSSALSSIELQYIGNGEWITLNSKGTITLF